MTGAPVSACTTRHSTTSSSVVAKPIITEAIENEVIEATSSCLLPNRAASHGVGGVPTAVATTLAVTIQEI